MDLLIESGINWSNSAGHGFCAYAWSALVQSSVLIVAILLLDLLLRKRVRAVVRYAVWMLVFAKLLLPPNLALPTGIGYYRPGRSAVVQETRAPEAIASESADGVVPVYAPIPPAAPEVAGTLKMPDVVADSESRAIVPIPPVAARPALSWRAVVFVGWLVGVLALCLCLARRFRYVRRLVAGSAAAPTSLQAVLGQCAARLSLRRCPQLRLSDDVPGPVVCRLLSPVVLIPATLTEKVDPDRFEAVLVHELAHVKRADLWINFVQTILLVAYFYHPLLWLVNAIVRRLREQAVDETVLVALDAEAERYSTTLIDLAEMSLHGPTVGLRLIGIAESRKALQGRIRHMMKRPKPRTARIGLWGLLALALAAAVLLPMARAQRGMDAAPDLMTAGAQPRVEDSGEDHHVTPFSLTSLERRFIDQILDLVDEVEKAHPEQVNHWPNGPTLFHVDGNGQVTVWRYQRLCRRSTECAEDEVGYGSSRIVDAEGMYYLPDGTPVPSRWRYRQGGGGMHDIRVKVGRLVEPEERVALIHRHRLHGDHDLSSRETRRRSIILNDFFADGPVRIIVRVDRPLESHNWWVGDEATSWEYFDDYALLTVSGPPRDNRGPMLLTVTRPEGAAQNTDASVESPANLEARAVSGTRLMDLGKALRVYADDHDDRFPGRMADAVDCYPINLSWLQAHVVYLGKGKTMSSPAEAVLAYDKTLLAKGQGTLVLFADTHVDFRSKQELKSLGVPASQVHGITSEKRVESQMRLAELGKVVLLYARDHDGKLPEKIEDMRDQLGMATGWLKDNVTYWGKGMTTKDSPVAPIAFDKTLLQSGPGTNVLYLDAHVTFESRTRLEEIGIKPPPRSAAVVQEEAALRNRVASQIRLMDLGKALLIYANDHDDKFPETLSGLREEVGVGMSWLLENVTYLGKDISPVRDHPARVLAYDKTLLERGEGTNVLYLDSHVAFETPKRLEHLGVTFGGKVLQGDRRRSAKELLNLGKALLIYANDHRDKFPDTLQDARDYINENGELSWVMEHVTYLGKGVSPRRANPASALAYDKTLLAKGAGTNVLYMDSHVAFETPEVLAKLGIRPVPRASEATQKDPAIQARLMLLSRLKRLALAGHLYAGDHGGVFPDDLEALAPYLGNEKELRDWARANVEYVGKGAKAIGGAHGAQKPLVWCRMPDGSSSEAGVAFQDGHAEIVRRSRFEELDIEIER